MKIKEKEKKSCVSSAQLKHKGDRDEISILRERDRDGIN